MGAVINILGPELRKKDRAVMQAMLSQNDNGSSNCNSNCSDGDGNDTASDDGSAPVNHNSNNNNDDVEEDERYELLKSVLSDAIALGAIRSCIFDHS